MFVKSKFKKKGAYAKSNIKAARLRLASLAKNCLLDQPELVKGFVAQKEFLNAFKERLLEAYECVLNSEMQNGFSSNGTYF